MIADISQRAKKIWLSLLGSSIVEKDGYYPFIDGLRGVAILMVVLVHTSALAGNALGAFRFGFLEKYVNSGGRGVQLFFILSAFTLFSSSLRRFKTDRKPVLSFYIRRAFRILPLWLIIVAVWAAINHSSIVTILASATFIFGFLRFSPAFDLVPGSWSLFVEETFYVFLPLIFTRIKNIYAGLALLIATITLSTLWISFASHQPKLWANSFAGFFPFTHWFAFALGIVAFFIISNVVYMKNVWNMPEKRVLLDVAAISSLLLFLPKDLYLATFALFIFVIAASSPDSISGKLMRNRLLMRFGKYCYSIYLIHFLILYWLKPFAPAFYNTVGLAGLPVDIKLLIIFPIISAICLVVAFISFNLFEKNCVYFGRSFLKYVNRDTAKKEL